MVARDPDEEHRASTPLELLFDLCFVVAVSSAASGLYDGLVAGKLFEPITGFLMLFFAIWWAWMNFTWFASAYDSDDVPYRLLTLMTIAGVLVLAAGVPAAFDTGDFKVVTVGYVIMRVALFAQWRRAAASDPEGRAVARRYAAGVAAIQLLWLGRLLIPTFHVRLVFIVLVVLELAVPIVAERAGRATPWHPEHISERYGLFTIIVLGECILAATVAVQSALTASGVSAQLLVVAGAGLVIVFAVWWSYFQESAEESLREGESIAFWWGYSHYLVFACIAALGAGLEVAAGSQEHHGEGGGHELLIGDGRVALAVAVPLAVYLGVLSGYRAWMGAEGLRPQSHVLGAAVLVLVAGVGAAGVGVPASIVLMALAVAGVVVIDVIQDHGVSASGAAGSGPGEPARR